MRRGLAALAALLAMALPSFGKGCVAVERLPLETDWYGGVTVPVAIGGRTVTLLVDTGGVQSMLTESTVRLLGLATEPIRNTRVTLYGGKELTRMVRVKDAAVGGTDGAPSAFFVMPDNRIPYALSGTLAPDFLSRFDVSFDFANAAMTLYEPGSCPAEGIAVLTDANRHLIVPAELDGKTVPAMLDTGASRSDFSLETARDLFALGSADLAPASRSDAEPGVFTHAFQTLAIGGIRLENPDLLLVPDGISRRPADSPRLVLGMNILRRLTLRISYAKRRLSVAHAP